MIAALLAVLLAVAPPAAARRAAPEAVVIASAAGERRVPVRADGRGAPRLAAAELASALGARLELHRPWLELTLAGVPFRFLLDAPLVQVRGGWRPLAAAPTLQGDTVWLPFQVVAEVLPAGLGAAARYDRARARLVVAAVLRAPLAG
ncbi:MAG: hypothetical protein NW201_15370, partial [Gemmatimonadales bacterium]|nr:hypothetical protein [Gemmatimonadales bacterium]